MALGVQIFHKLPESAHHTDQQDHLLEVARSDRVLEEGNIKIIKYK